MQTPSPVPSILPPGISHPAKRSCTHTSPDDHGVGQGRRGNMHPPGLPHNPHPPSVPPPHHPHPPDSGRRGYTHGRHDHMITPRGGWQISASTPRGTWQGLPPARSAGHMNGHGHRRDGKQSVPFVPSEGDMKIQLSSTTMAWVDIRGNILHSWKRTKRGTRGGKNRRQEEFHGTPRTAEPTPRDCSKPPPAEPETKEQPVKENSLKVCEQTPEPATPVAPRRDSECSSTCELNDEHEAGTAHPESVHTPTALVAHNRQGSHVSSEFVGDADECSVEQMLIPDPSSVSSQEMAELITRLYGLVNVLQNDNEQLRKTCAEIQLTSSSSDSEVAQLKQKLQQVTSERDLLQQQVLFQH